MRPWFSLPSVLLVTLVCAAESAEPAPMLDATVVHVDDGDTIDVRIDGRVERVRYIGIDAPEVAHEGVSGARGAEAAARLNRALLGGRRVRLELDRETRDRYGRLLAYVWAGDTMINLEMARRGYARVLTIPPNVRYEGRFARAEAEAQEARLGLWGDGDPDVPSMAPTRHAPPRRDRPTVRVARARGPSHAATVARDRGDRAGPRVMHFRRPRARTADHDSRSARRSAVRPRRSPVDQARPPLATGATREGSRESPSAGK